MAHNLAITNGRAEIFYTGEAPWHGLGTRLDDPATAAEAIEAAGLGWEVELQPMQTLSGLSVPMERAVVRKDTQTVLGSVGNRWTPVQNAAAFDFLDAVAGWAGIRYETAGALGLGEVVWMLGKIQGQVRIGATDDVVDRYLLLSNNHNGRGSLRAAFTPIRVVCANTLSMAEKDLKGSGVAIRHSGDVMSKVREARRVLGMADKFYECWAEEANFLATKALTPQTALDYFEAVVPMPEDPEASRVAARNAREAHDRLFGLLEHGRGNDMPGIKHTYWAAFNAFTESVDWAPKSIGAEKAENRLASIWFGAGAQQKSHAFRLAVEHASRN